ncbi:MAG: 4-hydroxy-tetrahydrodipicolinate synthase [Cytophagaceae bacterium]|jgi:4-hydroxy-tetrahydrodipicolinate synthase|nr:4-hydroxy-tetrahydrodipicolinate synthase [Cytophagaceae bacterium]
MNIRNLRGSIVAIATPFKENGEIDFETFDGLLEWHIAQGTNAIVVCGTTGETPTLTEEEDEILIKRAVDVINKRIPVIAGSGSNATHDCVKYSQTAEKNGADAVLVITPYYNKPARKGLYRHFSTVSQSINIPVILYNVPSRTGCNIPYDLAIQLANDNPGIMGIKEAGGSIDVFANLLLNRPEGFKVYSGDDFLSMMANFMGADGCISVVANIIPREFRNLMEYSLNGDVEKARLIFSKYKRLMDLMFIESSPIPVKAALAAMGKIGEIYRLPLCEMETNSKELLLREMKKTGLL